MVAIAHCGLRHLGNQRLRIAQQQVQHRAGAVEFIFHHARLEAPHLAGALYQRVSDEQEADLERIQVNQRHLLGLINSILNFTRLEAGQVQFRTTAVSLAGLLDGLDALVAPQMRAKSLALTIGPVDAGLRVLVDEEKFRQILLNLLTNALKFTANGGRVDISSRRDGADARVVVRDTGRGIAAADLVSVFDPFVQVDRHVTPESEQGVGLGLAISRELARGMKGDLTAESEPGVGSSFTVTLPLAP